MIKANAGLMNEGIEGILELSADAHIRRQGTAKDSPEYHKLTGAIAAYGKTLALLTALQEREEFHAIISPCDAPPALQPVG
jgi:hypothetical protein